MKKSTAFGLGILVGALAITNMEVFNAKHGEVLFEDDKKVIKEAGRRTEKSKVNSAVIFYKE